MAGRAALLFVGVILVGVFLNLYYLVFSIFAVTALGVESKLVLDAAYWLCLVSWNGDDLLYSAWPLGERGSDSTESAKLA